MMKKYFLSLFCFAFLLMGCNQQPRYMNMRLSPEKRADDLLSRLTLEEKTALMQNSSPAIDRLGIKSYAWWNEALHGVGRNGLATVFPQTIGMAACFDEKLIQEVFTAVSDEARAKNTEAISKPTSNNRPTESRYNGLTFWTPNINIFRDPRWGRGQETYGEDPYLTSVLGSACVRGLQGPENTKYNKLHACAKHFAVHSGPESTRHVFNAENIDPRDLNETYLPAFKTLVTKAKVKEVMCAYNRLEGDPCCGNNTLLMQILRKQWGFKGVVVSDCGAIYDFYKKGFHETHPNVESASSAAVRAGTDLNCGSSFPKSLPNAVKEGLINENEIDINLRRVLIARFQLGEMDDPSKVEWTKIPSSVIDSKEHRDLAVKTARETMTLLQNNGVLPIPKKGKKIIVMGPNAADSTMQWGNYNGTPGKTVTILEGIRAKAGNVKYIKGCDLLYSYVYDSHFSQIKTADGKKGFEAKYWNSIDMNGKVAAVQNVTMPFNFNTIGNNAFATNVNLTNFSAQYKGIFTPTKNGKYLFAIDGDEGYKLVINGKEVLSYGFLQQGQSGKQREYLIKNLANSTRLINEYPGASFGNSRSARLYLLEAKAGRHYDIEIDYIQKRENAYLKFDIYGADKLKVKPAEDIAAEAGDAEIVIFAGGISPRLEGEQMQGVNSYGFFGGDRTIIELPKIQTEVLAALKKAGKKVVFVNCSGSAIALTEETKSCDAILQAWYPGQAGGAVADVLFGDYNPAGRLPVTFYANTSQLPDFSDYSMKNRTYRYMNDKPLFPFGYGLSYTTFEYGSASLSTPTYKAGGKLKITIPVRNTGDRDGEEVVQVYLKKTGDTEGPHKALRAFKRVNIKKGTEIQVVISMNDDSFEWFDTATNSMRVIPGKYELLYGSSSDNNDLQSVEFTIK